jgi:hypothetical protein
MPGAWKSWFVTKLLKTLDMSRAPWFVTRVTMPGTWESWFVTKHLKTLDISRAPGLGPGCSCLGAWVDPWSLTLV